MVKSNCLRVFRGSFVTFIVLALSAVFVIINSFITPSILTVIVSASSSRLPVRSLPARFVRVDPPGSIGPGSPARLVLTVEAADLTEFMDAYGRGFGSDVAQYPDDGGIVLHNPELCGGEPLDWVVYVHTSPGHRTRRQLLRDTWANLQLFSRLKFRVVFLLGLPPPNSTSLQAEINAEFVMYKDLVQGNFFDSYKNLTLKAVLGLRWVSQYCRNAPFAIKVDDDTFLNIFEIVRLMKENANNSRVIICPLWSDNTMPILRDVGKCMKWCVKRTELRGRTGFPQYCSGLSYALSTPLLAQLYNTSKSTPFFWIDDVYVTGLLTRKLPTAVRYVNTLSNVQLDQDAALRLYRNLSEPMRYYYVHGWDETKFMQLWRTLIRRLTPEQREMMSDAALSRWT